jgi:ketosteroid isomerase-like protein
VSALSDVARSWIRAINGRDPDATVALVTPDFELVESSTLPGAARAVGADGLRRYIAGWARNWSDWEMREVELTEVPPAHAVLLADLRLRGLQSGIDVSRRWTYLLTIRGDKLAAQIGYDDVDEAIRAAKNQLPG